MKEIKLKGLNEVIMTETLDNGFNVYVWTSPKAGFFQGALTVFYGGANQEFNWKNKNYQVHCGAAHYLEHMICENENGLSFLKEFNKLGSSSNAHTSYFNTTYEFVGTKSLKENLGVLLDNVLNKNFDDINIERERNPILEEKRMRNDNPNVVAYNALNKMLYHSYPIKDDLIGTIDDINSITKEELQLIYNSFYHPANMALVVTGNISPWEVLKIVKEYFQNMQFPVWHKPKLKNYREKKSVNIKKQEIKANIEIPEITINIKVSLKPFKDYDIIKLVNAIRLVLATNFGSTSLLKEELLEKNLIYTLYFSAYRYYDYLIIEVGSKTKYPEEVEEILINKLKNIELLEEDIQRKIKSIVSTLVLSYEDPEEVNSIITECLVFDNKVIDNEKEILETLNMDYIKDIFSKISLKEMAILTMKPKKQ